MPAACVTSVPLQMLLPPHASAASACVKSTPLHLSPAAAAGGVKVECEGRPEGGGDRQLPQLLQQQEECKVEELPRTPLDAAPAAAGGAGAAAAQMEYTHAAATRQKLTEDLETLRQWYTTGLIEQAEYQREKEAVLAALRRIH